MKKSISFPIIKVFLVLLTVFTINIHHCFSQTNLPPVYEIKSDTIFWQKIESDYWRILEDKDGKWSLKDILQKDVTAKFHTTAIGIDSTAHTYWIVYQLQNTMNRDAKISLNSMSNFDDFYVKKDNLQWKHFASGKYQDWEKKDGFKVADCIPFIMKPGEKLIVYQRVYNTKPGLGADFEVDIINTDKMIQQYYIYDLESRQKIFTVQNLQEAFIIGMIFLAVFMNFFFYRIVKEKVYLYFALFAFFLGINRFSGISYSYFTLHTPYMLQYLTYLRLAWLFILFFLVQFFRYFLHTRLKFPKLDKLAIFTVVLFFLFNFLQVILSLFQITATRTVNLILIIIPVTIFTLLPFLLLVLQFLCLKQNGRAHRFVFFGSLPFLCLYIISSFFGSEGYRLFPTSLFSRFLISNFRLIEAVCLAILIISFTWVLFMRFIDLRKENAQQALDKERLAKEKEIERNELIEGQKAELEQKVEDRTSDLKKSYENLKLTQTQLIQSEKMAALGELTAGIAHEIQNPLNFVNNFSEVSNEMIQEIKEERKKNKEDRDEAIENELLEDISSNLEKINHHGKRADAIVKGMLQHSRSSSGKKEPTDLNALCDEYLRLSYHGLRAKDKSFNATMKTDFDETIGKINVIPQDFGRVVLNLLNNAFYAVSPLAPKGGKMLEPDYEPTVSISTKKENDKIIISVSDNGNGMPPEIIDKIFQPFFTTKPTGQGTGLGLSLSYDIITKGHGGELKVESTEGEGLPTGQAGTKFSIILPI